MVAAHQQLLQPHAFTTIVRHASTNSVVPPIIAKAIEASSPQASDAAQTSSIESLIESIGPIPEAPNLPGPKVLEILSVILQTQTFRFLSPKIFVFSEINVHCLDSFRTVNPVYLVLALVAIIPQEFSNRSWKWFMCLRTCLGVGLLCLVSYQKIHFF